MLSLFKKSTTFSKHRLLFCNNKLLFCVAVFVTVSFAPSFDVYNGQYDWKMNVKWGHATHIQDGFASFGPSTRTLCRAKNNLEPPWTNANTLMNNPAGILARTAQFYRYDGAGTSMLTNLVYWTVDDLHKAVRDSCLYTGYGSPTYGYDSSSHFYVKDIVVATVGQPLPQGKWGTILRFSNEIRITGSTGIWEGNGNIDVKLYEPNTSVQSVEVEEL